MSESIETHLDEQPMNDAFVTLGLVSSSHKTWDEKIRCRLQVLYSFRSDLERFVFLSDLRTSNPVLLGAVFQRDLDMAAIYSEVDRFFRTVAHEQPFLPISIAPGDHVCVSQ